MGSSQSTDLLRIMAELSFSQSRVAFLEEAAKNSVSRELYEAEVAARKSLESVLDAQNLRIKELEADAAAKNAVIEAQKAAVAAKDADIAVKDAKIKECEEKIAALTADNADSKTLAEFWRQQNFIPSSETMTDMMDKLVGKMPENKRAMLAEIANFISECDRRGMTAPVNKVPEEKTVAEKKMSQRKQCGHKERGAGASICVDVREFFGPDFSGMPPGAKIIMRRGKEDTWTIEIICMERTKVYSRMYTMARCNVPGEDPMNSKYPPRLFNRIPVDPSFARFYLEMKFGYNMSEGRILDMLGKMGCRIKQATLNRWMHIVIEGLYKELMPKIMTAVKGSRFTHNDETRILVRSWEDDKAKPEYKTEYIHGILSPEANLFMMLYEEGSRSHDVQLPIFKDSGIIAFLADRCAIYTAVEKALGERPPIRGACWVHFRRYLLYAYLQDKRLERVVRLLAMLFAAEKIISEIRNLTELQRVRERDAMCRPLVEAIFGFMETVAADGSDYGVLARRAADYLLGDREGFTAFLSCGLLEIGNNAVERCFRHIAGGRDNWLQCGSHDAARHTAFMYSLVESCRMNKIDFGKYIETVLRRIQEGETDKGSLLPNAIVMEDDDQCHSVA